MAEVGVKSLSTRAASGAAWGLVDNVSQQAISLLIFVILGRLLTPSLFGIVSTAMVFIYLMRSTILNAVSTGLVALSNPKDIDYDTGFWICTIISIIFFVILNLASYPISQIYEIPDLAHVLQATSIILLFLGFGYAHAGWARRNFMFKQLAVRNVLGVIAGGVCGIGIAMAGYGITALVLNQVIAGLVSLALLWLFIPWRPRFRFEMQSARAIMTTAVPWGATQSVQFMAQNFDTALVTYLLGPFVGGLYAAAKRITLAIQLAVWQPISAVSLPAFAEIIDDPARVNRALVKTGGLVIAVTVPAFVAVGATSHDLIVLLFGAHWADAAPVLAALSLFGAVVPSLGVLHQMVIAKGRAQAVLWFIVVQSLIAFGAVMLFGRHSATAIAICLSAPTLVTYILTLAFLKRIMPFPLGQYLLAMARPLFCGALMAGAMLALPNLDMGLFVQLAVSLLVGGGVYVVTLYVLAKEIFMECLTFGMRLVPKRLRPGKFPL